MINLPVQACEIVLQSQQTHSLVPRRFTAADGLHHHYVKSGSGKVLYSFLSSFPRMLGNQSDSRYAVIAYLCYNRAINGPLHERSEVR